MAAHLQSQHTGTRRADLMFKASLCYTETFTVSENQNDK